MRIQMQLDTASLDRAKMMMAELKGIEPKVKSRAINRSLTSVRAEAVSLIGLDLNLTATKIRESFTMNNATVANPTGSVVSKSKPIPLIDFNGTRELARGGVSVQVKRTGERVKLLHAFIATMKSGHRGVFEREAGNFGRPFQILKNYAAMPKKYRLPIDELFGPRITDEYSKGPIIEAVQRRAAEVYTANYAHELDYYLGLL